MVPDGYKDMQYWEGTESSGEHSVVANAVCGHMGAEKVGGCKVVRSSVSIVKTYSNEGMDLHFKSYAPRLQHPNTGMGLMKNLFQLSYLHYFDFAQRYFWAL